MTDLLSQEQTKSKALPDGWTWTTLEELAATLKSGGTPSTKRPDFYDGDIPYAKVEDIVNAGKYLDSTKISIAQAGIDNSSAWVVPTGSLLYTMYASYGVPTISKIDAATNQAIIALIPSAALSSLDYLYYYLWSIKPTLVSLIRGTTQANLNAGIVKSIEVPLPPLNEQRRIVEKIEELFTKLDAGVRSLEQARKQLKSYRRSVLKAAVEGELSREWREAHRDDLEPASELLDRILQERREKFAGKKYKEPAAPDISELSALPDGWVWSRAEQLCDFITKGTTPKADKLSKAGYVPFIKVYNLTHSGILDFSVNPTFVDNETHRGFLSRSRVYPNDVLMNIVGPPLGKVSIVPDFHAEWNINQAIAVFRPLPSYDTKFLSHLLLTSQILDWAKRRAKATAGQFNFTLAICRDLPLPLPPLEEQHFIVEEVERRLSVVDKLEATVDDNLKQAAGLRQSILKQAFSGELVPQDPDDEPASVLLARIRSEREATKPKAKRPRKVREDGEAQGRLI